MSGDTELLVRMGAALSEALWPDEYVVRLYLANGGQGTAEEIASTTHRSVEGVKTALARFVQNGEAIREQVSFSGRGRPRYRYHSHRSSGQRTAHSFLAKERSRQQRADVWRLTKVGIAEDYLKRIVQPACPARPNPVALRRLAQLTNAPHPSVAVCREAFARGLPSPMHGLVPLLYAEPWGAKERYTLRAYGFAGILARGLKENESLKFTFGLDLWLPNSLIIGTAMDIDKVARREEMSFEWLVFQLTGYRPRRCTLGEHWYFADYRAQHFCLAHSDIGRQAMHRQRMN